MTDTHSQVEVEGSVRLLRRAAALMRERAEAATVVTGEAHWTSGHLNYLAEYGVTYQVHAEHQGSPVRVTDSGAEETAEHIASWHPVVALAVADWLDVMSVPDPLNVLAGAREHALAVARAYLGEKS